MLLFTTQDAIQVSVCDVVAHLKVIIAGRKNKKIYIFFLPTCEVDALNSGGDFLPRNTSLKVSCVLLRPGSALRGAECTCGSLQDVNAN